MNTNYLAFSLEGICLGICHPFQHKIFCGGDTVSSHEGALHSLTLWASLLVRLLHRTWGFLRDKETRRRIEIKGRAETRRVEDAGSLHWWGLQVSLVTASVFPTALRCPSLGCNSSGNDVTWNATSLSLCLHSFSWFCFTFAFLFFFLSPPNLSLFLLIILFLNSFLELTIALKFAVIYLYISYI